MSVKDERKTALRDWMTSTTQLLKVNHTTSSRPSTSDITYWWRAKIGVRMTDKWVEKALYGKKTNPRQTGH